MSLQPDSNGGKGGHSLKRGFGRLSAFFLMLAATALALHHLLNFGLQHIPTSEFGVANEIMAGRVNAEIVISGSSRALDHYDSRVIQKATGLKTFNIGRNASQTDMQLALLRAYLKHNARPRLVIQNLDSFTFESTHQIVNPGQYIPYLGEPEIYNALQKIDPTVWKWKYIPLYGYVVEDMRLTWMMGIGGILGLYPKEDLAQGYYAAYKPWTGDFERFRAANPDGVRFPVEAQGIRDLEDLVGLCRENGIPIVLVYSPVYYEMQALEKNRSDVFARFLVLSEHFHAPLWDYSGSLVCRQREWFYNSQHLNYEGASAFTADLAKRLAAEHPWQMNVLSQPVAALRE
jgi:hypothetical protein